MILIFELLFLPLLLTGKFRRLLATGAIGLHFAVWAVFDILFWHLWLLYPALRLHDLLLQARPAILGHQAQTN